MKEIVERRGEEINQDLKTLILNNLSEILTCLALSDTSLSDKSSDTSSEGMQNVVDIFTELYKKVKHICENILEGRSSRRILYVTHTPPPASAGGHTSSGGGKKRRKKLKSKRGKNKKCKSKRKSKRSSKKKKSKR
jgi:hypothetical protein